MAKLASLAHFARLNGGLALQRAALRCQEQNLIASRLLSSSWAAPTVEKRSGGWSSFGGMTAGLGLLAVGGAVHGCASPVRCDDGTAAASPAKAEPTLLQKCLAEAVGTGIIVHGGCGVVCAAVFGNSGLNTFQLSGIWGLSIALAIFATREISGAHLNPAVSLSLAANKDFPLKELGPYIAAQLTGATIAGGLNYLIHAAGITARKVKEGATTAVINGAFGMYPNASLLSPLGAIMAEVWMTALFVFLVFAVTDGGGTVPKDAAPVLIGGAAATLISIYGPLTGCGMNPARDLGPRLITALAGFGNVAWSHAWIYTVGPIVGAIIGGAFYQAFFAPLQPEKK